MMGSPRRVPLTASVSGRCSSIDFEVGCGCIHGQVGHQAGLPQCASVPNWWLLGKCSLGNYISGD